MFRLQSEFALAIRSCLGIGAVMVEPVGVRWVSRSRHGCRRVSEGLLVDRGTVRWAGQEAMGGMTPESRSVWRHCPRTKGSRERPSASCLPAPLGFVRIHFAGWSVWSMAVSHPWR